MLAFFRRIRKSVITNGSTKKYFFYAVGEILLVVIGILIAINLNNNNQNVVAKRDRDEKITKLRHIIYGDSLEMVSIINYNKRNSLLIDTLLQVLNNDLTEQGYLQFAKRFSQVNMQFRNTIPDLSVYNELVTSGEFSKIENEELKNRISSFYRLYLHFNDLILRFIDALFVSEKQLFYNGLLSHKYFRPNLPNETIIKGYGVFKDILNNPLKKRVLENHLFELKDMHEEIAFFYGTLINRLIIGIPLKPDNP